jgi:hypothetical protein
MWVDEFSVYIELSKTVDSDRAVLLFWSWKNVVLIKFELTVMYHLPSRSLIQLSGKQDFHRTDFGSRLLAAEGEGGGEQWGWGVCLKRSNILLVVARSPRRNSCYLTVVPFRDTSQLKSIINAVDLIQSQFLHLIVQASKLPKKWYMWLPLGKKGLSGLLYLDITLIV